MTRSLVLPALPRRVSLGRLGTPLETLSRTAERSGQTLLCKRDDLTGAALSGNKVRKLEFVLAEALHSGCDTVITCGGEQSNHARATAVAAARLGLEARLLLRTPDPTRPPAPQGNILLDGLCGASIRWITPAQYVERDALMAEEAQQLALEAKRKAYVIPEGASNALGSFGYVCCAAELAEQLGDRPATIVCAVGSGGTVAGLLAGIHLMRLPYRVVGVCVCDDRATFQRRIAGILDEMANCHGLELDVPNESFELWDSYVGRGYAQSRDEELSCIARVARTEGLLLDPVYTGKAFFGLCAEIEQGRTFPGPVVFLHSGGIHGLMAMADRFEPHLCPPAVGGPRHGW